MDDKKKIKTGCSLEEEFFAREEAEKIARLRKKLDEERRAVRCDQLKKQHWMCCPKCGHELEELSFREVMIDRCKGCKGVWLDDGELELLAGAGTNPLKAIFGAFRSEFKVKG
jgi:uncharacterized protein